MWWYPPQQSLTSSAIPAMEQFFGHPLFLWMPRKLWRVRLLCPHQDCGKAELTSAGLHQRVRLVVGVSGSYYLVAEYLACKSCKMKVISWSHNIVSQLDIGHRLHFPCLLTYKLGCDMQVVRMMRQRGLGNSSSQLQKQLEEQHAESWLGKTIQFLSAYRGVAISSGLILPVPLGDLPVMPAVPKHRWLMQVYAQDVLGRLDEVKASITSLFGQVLKMDSTKKIVRKLAGQARSTASWATNVGNEHGHVLMSVLTAREGWGLMKMAEGLVRRYKDAGVPPPEILYVDRDCCGNSHLLKIFGAWPGMKIRLDIWHFMRRFATGCTTDSHALYTSFMAQLSRCIFAWDQSDLQLLKAAKRAELEASHLRPTVEDVARHISKAETMLHCRRAVRESGEMGDLLKDLIEAYSGEKGCNTLGVPLINRARMAEILKAQLKHLPCLQDPPGFQLYTQTGTLKKAGHVLPTYRCARGSTSLESFHLHMNRFIPGTLASDTFFQAYLVDGLFRWNEDRTITAEGTEGPRSYSGLLKHAANQLSEEVLGRKLVEYTAPRKYTGELIGIEYLYNQNNAVMEDYKLALVTLETEDITVAEGESSLEPCDIEDPTVPTLDTIWPPQQLTPPAARPATALPAARPATALPAARPATALPAAPPATALPAARPATALPAARPATALPAARPATALPAALSAAFTVAPMHSAPQQDTQGLVDEQPSTSALGSTSHDDSVGPDNVEGFQAVQDLTVFLFKLKEHSLALSREEADEIISLWNCLSDFDKCRTVYPPRHQDTLAHGRFRTSKKAVAPGVESTKRCFAGGRSPAQWPDCNRVCEALFVQLCEEYRGSRRIDGVRHERWSLVMKAYLHIRQVVLNNATVMEKTSLQLPVVNTATLSSWYCKRERGQEKRILEQGICPPQTTTVSPESLPPAVQRKGKPCMPQSIVASHVFLLPPNTAGTAKLQGRKIRRVNPPSDLLRPPFLAALEPQIQPPTPVFPTPPFIPPLLPQPLWSVPQPHLPALQPAGASVVHVPYLPYTTTHYRKKKREEEEKTGFKKRKYTRSSATILCRQCQRERDPATHNQYYGNWYCHATATMTLAEWRAALEAQGYGRKKGAPP
ncbi:unnamed protein product [Arctogadus glacialis]